MVGGFPIVRAAIVIVAQILGATAAAGLVSVIFPGPLAVETTLGGGASAVQGFFIELFLTCELVFVILMMAVEKHRATFAAPVAIGLALFLSELVGEFVSFCSNFVPFCHRPFPPFSYHFTEQMLTDPKQASTSQAAVSTPPAPSAQPSSTATSRDTTGSTG